MTFTAVLLSRVSEDTVEILADEVARSTEVVTLAKFDVSNADVGATEMESWREDCLEVHTGPVKLFSKVNLCIFEVVFADEVEVLVIPSTEVAVETRESGLYDRDEAADSPRQSLRLTIPVAAALLSAFSALVSISSLGTSNRGLRCCSTVTVATLEKEEPLPFRNFD